jgi:small multidrug resistance pump
MSAMNTNGFDDNMSVSWIFLWLAILISVGGQTLLKAGALGRAHSADFIAQVLDPRTVAGLALYVGATFLYIVALRRIPLSVALPCTAASYIAAVFVGHFVYDEAITPTHIAAVVVIGFGVVLLALAAR